MAQVHKITNPYSLFALPHPNHTFSIFLLVYIGGLRPKRWPLAPGGEYGTFRNMGLGRGGRGMMDEQELSR